MKINEFKERDVVNFTAMIKSLNIRETKTGKPFANIELSDSSGSIAGNLWDVTKKQEKDFQPQTLVQVDANVETYQGKLQLKFNSIHVTTGDISEYIPSAPVDMKKYLDYIYDYVAGIQNSNWQLLCHKILGKYKEQFESYPAALSVHHAYHGGLAFHTSTMLAKANMLAKFYPWLNSELLCVGVILHDVGKSIEMPGLFGDAYTTQGELLGHIELILEDIVEICLKNDIDHKAEDILVLKHLIAAHHGKQEWGTISEPKLPEAAMLHMIDMMDAQMEQYRKVYEGLEPGQWSGKNYFLNNSRVYRPVL
ncbi:MAG: TraI domain-containing protein [Streptococcaceae bacterium]|jgi:3'-5' exoribonuclease|nr:TraI domain-containing protein [Streptococcaceae bacterium]